MPLIVSMGIALKTSLQDFCHTPLFRSDAAKDLGPLAYGVRYATNGVGFWPTRRTCGVYADLFG